MEEVFHGIKLDKSELKRVKELKKSTKALVETDDFIPFVLSEPSEAEEASSNRDGKAKKPKGDLSKQNMGKRDIKGEQKSKEPPSKKLRIESLLHKDMPWLDSTRRYSGDPTVRLHQELVDFVNWMGPTEQERVARFQCIERVQAVVSAIWPESEVLAYGSIRTQYYVPSSDIDLVVMIPEEEMGSAKKPPLRRLATLLKQAGVPEESSLEVIAKARVPIIKFKDAVTGYPVDISFNTTSGTESGDIISKYSIQYPALRPLTLFLKHFLEMRGLNEVYTGGIGSYTVTCLVLSFLQMHPLAQAGLIRPHENLGVMLLEMLELYGRHFNYDQVGIAVNPAEPGEYYYDKTDRGWLIDSRPGSLSIEDPQNRENDISKGSFSFHMVRQAFEHGFNALISTMDEFANLQHSRGRSSMNSYSILGSVVRLSDQLLRHRRYVQSTTRI